METVLDVRSVSRRFGKLVAVDDLSFEVRRGELFGLLGPNGAGKTTAINLITGLLRQHGGTITVLDRDPEKEARQVRRRISDGMDLHRASTAPARLKGTAPQVRRLQRGPGGANPGAASWSYRTTS